LTELDDNVIIEKQLIY